MTIEDLGYNEVLEDQRKENGFAAFDFGRIISEHKERYTIKTPEAEYEAELLGRLRFTAETRYDFPAVGDWVAFSEYDEGKALIHGIFPRYSVIERQAVGKSSDVQIIATNIDYGIIVQAVDRDFNLNRLERYLIICNASRVSPIIVLSKIDLVDEKVLNEYIGSVHTRMKDVPVVCVSHDAGGYKALTPYIKKGKTYCLLGSSGVGKSTLLNNLAGADVMETSEISTSVNKGRHTTSHRELSVLENGAIIIDNPGMREVGISDSNQGLEITFDTIMEYANQCKYSDCRHVEERGCAVLAALENGEIDEAAYDNFRKLEKEKMYFEANKIDRKKKEKDFGKMIKNIQKDRRKNKY
ncbi:ribosome small subunit-dependent GTPase A [Portibacter lacus]|nr:ribosome small subunit-dependent GTPase A [Portibacter lacus]